MSFVNFLIDVFLHLDTHMAAVIAQYGAWTYGLLFFVIFMETGFVVTPFLPGDLFIFAAGAFAAIGSLNLWLLLILFDDCRHRRQHRQLLDRLLDWR